MTTPPHAAPPILALAAALAAPLLTTPPPATPQPAAPAQAFAPAQAQALTRAPAPAPAQAQAQAQALTPTPTPTPTPAPAPAPARTAPPTAPPPQDPPKGHLYIVGGGHRGPALWDRFVDLAGGAGEARILVIPLASSEPEESGRDVADGYLEHGAAVADVFIPTRAEAEDPATGRRLDGYDGIWFTGGSQDRITDVLAGTALNRAIRDRYRAGAVIGGTSAGAAIMSDSMITGSQVLEGEDTIGYHGDEFTRIARGYLEIVPGLGYLPGAIVDQHFVRRERHNRLISAVLERPSMIGVGIDESTAIIVNPDGTWSVIGESAAVLCDARDATITPAGEPVLGARDIRLHVVPAGGRYDPATGRVTLP